MKTKSLLFTALFIVSITLSLVAQENFQPGYLVDQQGDTLKGFIDYRNWDRNPSKVTFRKDDLTSLTYEPGNIRAFSVEKDTYISATVTTDKALGNTPEEIYETETVFLFRLMSSDRSNKTLLHYVGSNSKEYFFIGQETKPELLVFKEYMKFNETVNRQTLYTNRKFLGQLSLYLNDCATIQKELKSVQYNRTSLSKLFLRYYDCTNTLGKVDANPQQLKVEFGLIAGMTITSVKFDGDHHEYLVNSNLNASVKPYGGLFLDLVLPRGRQKWSIYNELAVSNYVLQSTYKTLPSLSTYSVYDFNLSMTYVNLGTMLRFRSPARKVIVFANAGLYYGLMVSDINEVRRDVYNNSGDITRTEYDEALDAIRKNELGLQGGAGLKYKKYSFETRFSFNPGISDYIDFSSNVARTYVLFGYQF